MAELVPAGVEAALAAFRTGLYSLKMQRDVDTMSPEAGQSWSFIASLTESGALETIQAFTTEAVCRPEECPNGMANVRNST
jgi:hypothetical protein